MYNKTTPVATTIPDPPRLTEKKNEMISFADIEGCPFDNNIFVCGKKYSRDFIRNFEILVSSKL